MDSTTVDQVARQMAFGYGVKKAAYLPIGQHQEQLLFDHTQLVNSLTNYYSPVNSGEYTEISGSTVREFSSSLDTQMNVGGKSGALSASVSSELGLTSSLTEKTSFCQIRSIYKLGKVTFPSANTVAFRAELRNLLLPQVRAELNGCANADEAKRIVSAYGAFYISEAFYGGSCSITASAASTSTTATKDLSISFKSKYKSLMTKVEMGGSFEYSSSSSQETTTASYEKVVNGKYYR